MRRFPLAILMVLTLLVASAATVLAAGGGAGSDEHAEKGRARADEARSGEAGAAAANASGEESAHAARSHARGGDDATGRPAAVTQFLDRLRALRASWLENATAIRAECRADAEDADRANSTKEERLAYAHCIRDGYRAWRVAWVAEMRELRDERARHGGA